MNEIGILEYSEKVIKKQFSEVKLDHGRLALSEAEKAFFGDTVAIIKGRDCFILLREEEWDRIVEEKLSDLKGKELREMRRNLGRLAFIQEIKKGSILFPKELRKEVKK